MYKRQVQVLRVAPAPVRGLAGAAGSRLGHGFILFRFAVGAALLISAAGGLVLAGRGLGRTGRLGQLEGLFLFACPPGGGLFRQAFRFFRGALIGKGVLGAVLQHGAEHIAHGIIGDGALRSLGRVQRFLRGLVLFQFGHFGRQPLGAAGQQFLVLLLASAGGAAFALLAHRHSSLRWIVQ